MDAHLSNGGLALGALHKILGGKLPNLCRATVFAAGIAARLWGMQRANGESSMSSLSMSKS